jgi:two-component system, cell cycle sensor histidine kinase and response regulator CckA
MLLMEPGTDGAPAGSRVSDLLHGIEAVIWEADARTLQFLFVSEYAEPLFGYSIAEWTSRSSFWQELIHPEDRQRVFEDCLVDPADTVQHDLEHRALAADGRVVWVRNNIRVVSDSHGQPWRLQGVMMEITEHKRMEEQLRGAQRMEAIGRLAGGVAHDFNNMLAVINGYSDLLLSRGDLPGEARIQIDEIQRAGERAADLTRQLLTFSRRQVLTLRVLDLNEVVANTSSMLRRLIGEDIDLQFESDPALRKLKGDRAQIEQVLVNLVVNARDAMPQGGTLVVETQNVDLDHNSCLGPFFIQPGPYVTLSVRDTGCGMDEETQSHIFEPFFTTKPVGKGTGLGLSTVYGSVKQNGGYICVRSCPGEGTTFTIYLPCCEDVRPVRTTPTLPSPARAGTETVLLVEDEELVRGLAKSALQKSGYTVLEATDGGQALSLIHSVPGIDLLLTDVVMPGLNGRALAQRFLALQPDAKVLFMSGYPRHVIVESGGLEAGTDLIEKPFSIATLAKRVRAALDGTDGAE